MPHRCDGAVVCDIISHVVGERLDLGHSVAHGHGRLDSGEHTQIVAGIAKAKADGKSWGGRKAGTRIKLTEEKEKLIRQLHAEGKPKAVIARLVGLTRKTVYAALRRKVA